MVKKEYPRIGESLYHGELVNGLHVYVDVKPEFSKSYAFFATNYGGMDMRFQLNGEWHDTPAGVAHFLEHKMFDTKDGNALQDLAANGASPNAFTSSAITGYYFESTEKFEENLKILLSFVSEPWFTPESVDKEQGIIGQEIRMIEDDPENQVFYGMMETLYVHNPIKVSIAGTVESISHITADTLYGDCGYPQGLRRGRAGDGRHAGKGSADGGLHTHFPTGLEGGPRSHGGGAPALSAYGGAGL